MAYIGDLGTGQQIYLRNAANQTIITLMSGSPGQQQSQQTSVQTGAWTLPPTLLRIPAGFVLRIEAANGQFFVHIQGGGMSLLHTNPSLAQADVLPLRQTSEAETSTPSMPPMEPMRPMEPLKPMEPMKMGDMEMRTEPMEMRMGNMHLSMGTPPQPPQPSAKKRFCTQCGAPVNARDRFCASCGHSLTPMEA